MMRYLLLFLAFTSFKLVFSQQNTSPESFQIVEIEDPVKLVFYTHSIAKADMENYRLKEKNVTLEFRNGFKCVLYSAKELFIKGVKIDVNSYQDDFPLKFSLPVFEVNDNGWITAGFSTNTKYISK